MIRCGFSLRDSYEGLVKKRERSAMNKIERNTCKEMNVRENIFQATRGMKL